MIAIVDYGVGNLRSVERALLQAGANPRLTSDLDELAAANGLVLPGVGAFGPALRKLEQGNLGRWVVEQARKGKPLLGVCLGYQLLFDESEEHGRHQGLGLLSGRVVQISGSLRLPVIGWCKVRQTEWSPLWQGIADDSYLYFVHSYTPEGSFQAIATTEHSPAAAAGRLNVVGTQFHPEKSGETGLKVYSNFLEICGAG
ncbi:MAG: imidazole glycerol phosphate synthase subunit HisH [Candidatus Dormibacteraeota bacterium]|nr:imidazole glycerol phosphate synthase subunit HisH [Candidatus Dormibacteraeota bacterium]